MSSKPTPSLSALELSLMNLPPDLQAAAVSRLEWLKRARSKQIPPAGTWRVALWLAGRGWGKTETGAQDIAHFGIWNQGVRIAIVAPTFADARDVCVEGVSGLLQALGGEGGPVVERWNRSIGELDLKNGTKYRLFSAEKPNSLRGPQHHRAWCDELAAWGDEETWDMLMLGLRLGEGVAQAIVTTTPKPTPLMKSLLKRPDVAVIRGSTYENIGNLSPTFKAEILARYEGTRLGRQELYAELLEDAQGALWTRGLIDSKRLALAPSLKRIVVAIDPAATNTEQSDETGIIVAGVGTDGRGYILEDLSGKYSPDQWARKACDAYHRHMADRVVAEVNNGGDMVGMTLRTMDKHISYKELRASKAKRARAEPVAALYEQGRVSHVGQFAQLEDQLCSWEPDGDYRSPDRLDALVWALTELMLERTQAIASIAVDNSWQRKHW
jgi:phage terminase large subunit-like protein